VGGGQHHHTSSADTRAWVHGLSPRKEPKLGTCICVFVFCACFEDEARALKKGRRMVDGGGWWVEG